MENDCFCMLLQFHFSGSMDRSSQTFLNPSSCNRKYRQVVQVYLVS